MAVFFCQQKTCCLSRCRYGSFFSRGGSGRRRMALWVERQNENVGDFLEALLYAGLGVPYGSSLLVAVDRWRWWSSMSMPWEGMVQAGAVGVLVGGDHALAYRRLACHRRGEPDRG